MPTGNLALPFEGIPKTKLQGSGARRIKTLRNLKTACNNNRNSNSVAQPFFTDDAIAGEAGPVLAMRLCPRRSRAARLAAIPVGASPTNRGVQSLL
jgi:hypothetical protein